MSSRLIFLLIATITAWILAANSGSHLAYSISYLLTAVLLFSYLWAWSSLRGIEIRRATRSRRSQVGQLAEEHFEVSNQSPFPKLWLEIEDFSTLPIHNPSRVISAISRRSSYRWHTRTPCVQRGRFQLGPVRMRSGDPLGIFEVSRDLAILNSLVVYPLVIPIATFEPSIANLSGGEARHRRTLQITTNAAGVRDYMPGDGFNHIHWPTTARARRLMTKEFELDPTADIWLYVDLNRSMECGLSWTPSAPEVNIFSINAKKARPDLPELPPITTEYAVTVAATLANYFVNKDRAVGMTSQGTTREFLQPDRGERQLLKILEELAVVEAVGNMPFANFVAGEGVRLNRNDTLIAISADPSREWALALHMLQRRGVNSVAIVIDGTTFGGGGSYDALFGELEAIGVPAYHLHRDDNIEEALARRRVSQRYG